MLPAVVVAWVLLGGDESMEFVGLGLDVLGSSFQVLGSGIEFLGSGAELLRQLFELGPGALGRGNALWAVLGEIFLEGMDLQFEIEVLFGKTVRLSLAFAKIVIAFSASGLSWSLAAIFFAFWGGHLGGRQ